MIIRKIISLSRDLKCRVSRSGQNHMYSAVVKAFVWNQTTTWTQTRRDWRGYISPVLKRENISPQALENHEQSI